MLKSSSKQHTVVATPMYRDYMITYVRPLHPIEENQAENELKTVIFGWIVGLALPRVRAPFWAPHNKGYNI